MRPTRRRRRVAAPALAVALGAVPGALALACFAKRERLDVPRLTLDVQTLAPSAGGRISGRVAATDGSGLIALNVYACTVDSVFRQRESYDRARAAAFDFDLHVAVTARDGDPVELFAVAVDDQNLYAESSRVVHVGGAGITDGAGLCSRVRSADVVELRPARASAAAGARAGDGVPTAP